MSKVKIAINADNIMSAIIKRTIEFVRAVIGSPATAVVSIAETNSVPNGSTKATLADIITSNNQTV